jgi:hypothetical protein
MMKRIASLAAFLVVGSTSIAFAQSFSVSGPGGTVPDCDYYCATWNTQPNWPIFTSTVNVGDAVASITNVRLSGWTCDRRADIQVFLTAPNGVRYNLVVRPGFTNSFCDGDDGDYLLGDYDIVQTGGATLEQGSTDISGGTYDQYLHIGGGGEWTSTSYPINNTPLNSISGPFGTWTLSIVDWFNQDLGLLPSSIGGWTLQGIGLGGPLPPVTICEPGANGIIPCPCVNPPSGPGRGCNNSSGTGGATLTASGVASVSADTLVFTTTDEKPSALSIVLQGDEELASGTPYGDGVRCVGENLRRLYVKSAVSGTIIAPSGSDPSVTARSAALGHPILAGVERRYQVYYRDPLFFACPSPGGSSFNMTVGLRVPWTF